MHRFRIDDFLNFTNAQYFCKIEIPIRNYETLKFGRTKNSGQIRRNPAKFRRQPAFLARSPCSGQSVAGDSHQSKALGLGNKTQPVRRRETAEVAAGEGFSDCRSFWELLRRDPVVIGPEGTTKV